MGKGREGGEVQCVCLSQGSAACLLSVCLPAHPAATKSVSALSPAPSPRRASKREAALYGYKLEGKAGRHRAGMVYGVVIPIR